jgi:peptidyl-prolyl cis-trans isomerase D
LPNETNNAIKRFNQTRDIKYAVSTVDSLKNTIKLTDQEIQDYYQQHQDEFKMSEQISVSYVELFANDLKNKISVTPDETLQYYKNHIDKYSTKDKIYSFSKVHEQVTKAVTQEKLAELFSEKTNKLADLAYTNSDSLLPVATELGLLIKTTDLFTEQGKKIGILGNSKFVKTAFSDAVLKQNYNSDIVELEPGHVLVMRVKEHKMAAIKPLLEVKAQIVQQLTTIAASQKAKALGERLVAAVKIDSSANQQGLSWKVLKVKRQGTPNLDPLLIRAAFSVLPSNGRLATVGLILQNGDFAIVQVDKIYDGDSKNFNKKQLKSFKHNMAAVFGEIDYNLYVADLIGQAKIKIKEYGK